MCKLNIFLTFRVLIVTHLVLYYITELLKVRSFHLWQPSNFSIIYSIVNDIAQFSQPKLDHHWIVKQFHDEKGAISRMQQLSHS